MIESKIERRRRQKREEYRRNREGYLIRAKKRYSEKKDEVKAYIAQWKIDNRDKVRATNAKRKAKFKVELNPDEKLELEGVYSQCLRLNNIFGGDVFVVDHTKPLSRGGAHHPSNLQIVPAHWNLEKGSSHENRWEAPYFGQRDLNKRLFSE
jgi:5-methylcytosine-specific restriction endonuclease McrA|tara:strand:+ start:326 stop:781 length:456 start_codon:yes stop_codon:yes gene_type:complete